MRSDKAHSPTNNFKLILESSFRTARLLIISICVLSTLFICTSDKHSSNSQTLYDNNKIVSYNKVLIFNKYKLFWEQSQVPEDLEILPCRMSVRLSQSLSCSCQRSSCIRLFVDRKRGKSSRYKMSVSFLLVISLKLKGMFKITQVGN